MKTKNPSPRLYSGNALVITMMLTATALLTLAGILGWSSGGARQSNRFSQYTRTVSAAEAATEKVAGNLMQDFLNNGEALVTANLGTYQQTVPTTSDSPYWANWQFSNPQGGVNQTYVQKAGTTAYTVLGSTYAGLYGFVSTYNVVSDAAETTDLQAVTVGNLQSLQLTTIPVFQFAMYTSGDMEIEPGADMVIGGPVHSNGNLYEDPSGLLEFKYPVTVVGGITFGRNPAEQRSTVYGGNVQYDQGYKSNSATLTLPIGTTNTPTAVRAIIQPPPLGESASSSLGSVRYYNRANMVIQVTSLGVTATSGSTNSFLTLVPVTDVAKFVAVTNLFYDEREAKFVYPVDINVSNLTAWVQTNGTLGQISSIYVNDVRTTSSSILKAVRLYNGAQLPTNGLTVATADPIYIWGNYNQTNSANLLSTNTINTKPSSVAGDAITVLSAGWSDASSSSSTSALGSRPASPTTVNTAIIAGSVYTTNGYYSGGMENFMRLLENWNGVQLEYNGSMVVMFPSQYATNYWPNTGVVYNPPNRQYNFDQNFNTPALLPPLTPGLLTIARTQWATVVANSISASTNAY
jgi:hypothetical protein